MTLDLLKASNGNLLGISGQIMNRPTNKRESIGNEVSDAEIHEFLVDIDIALGQSYQEPNRQLFPYFYPHYHAIQPQEFLLYERLAAAYRSLENPRKPKALKVLGGALLQCSRSPIGLKRSLVCIDLAHEIDPALGSESIYSDLMLRPDNPNELAEWLWQLVRRWDKWNIRVEATEAIWKRAMSSIAPKGICKLIDYFAAQNAAYHPDCWKQLCRIATDRINLEDEALYNARQDPDEMLEHISRIDIYSISGFDDHLDFPLVIDGSALFRQVSNTLRPSIRPLINTSQGRKLLADEIEWAKKTTAHEREAYFGPENRASI